MVGTLGLISALMLTLERNEAASRREAQLQEAIRVALARMESRLSPILSREAARPYFHYASFYGADEAYTRMLRPDFFRKKGIVRKLEVFLPVRLNAKG